MTDTHHYNFVKRAHGVYKLLCKNRMRQDIHCIDGFIENDHGKNIWYVNLINILLVDGCKIDSAKVRISSMHNQIEHLTGEGTSSLDWRLGPDRYFGHQRLSGGDGDRFEFHISYLDSNGHERALAPYIERLTVRLAVA